METFRRVEGSTPIQIAAPPPYMGMDMTHTALPKLQELFEQEAERLRDKALTIGLDEFKPGLVVSIGLENAKRSLRFSDMLDGDAMVYWQPTDEVVMLLCAPKLIEVDGALPTINVNYRTPTPKERAELTEINRRGHYH